jgi:hypothetical protein
VGNNPVNSIDPSGRRECGPNAWVYPWDETCDEIIDLCRRWPNHHICGEVYPDDNGSPLFTGVDLPSDCSALIGTPLACKDPDPVTKVGIIGTVFSPIIAPILAGLLAEVGPTTMCMATTEASVGAGAAESALIACGGDCSDEVSSARQALEHFLETGEGNLYEILKRLENLGVTIEENFPFLDARGAGGVYEIPARTWRPGTFIWAEKVTGLSEAGHEVIHFLQHMYRSFSPHLSNVEGVLTELEAYWWQYSFPELLGGAGSWAVENIENQIIYNMHTLYELQGFTLEEINQVFYEIMRAAGG